MRIVPSRYLQGKPLTLKKVVSKIAHLSAPLKGLSLSSKLTQAEKKSAMDIRTVNQIIDYIERLAAARLNAGAPDRVEHLSPAAEP